jgi:outer membrane protein TolC
MKNISISTAIFFIVAVMSTQAQQIVTLQDVLERTQSSFFVSDARTQKEIAQNQNNLYLSQLKPQIGLDALVPNFIKTSREIVQPNGSVAFQSISQNNASASLYASQAISATGGRVFVQSDLQRFDDFTNEAKLYNGLPIRIGIEQPIFGYNPFKYGNKLADLQLEESRKQYNLDVERALLSATELYFNVLIAAENKSIAITNRAVNKGLLDITYERYKLGKVSKDEKLQLEIELKNSELNSTQAAYAHNFALSQLYTYLGLTPDTSAVLQLPDDLPPFSIDMSELEAAVVSNSPLILAFYRRTLDADDFIAQQKADYGIKTHLFASYGYARGSQKLADVYQNPFDEQQVRLSISIPLVDWGRKKSAIRIAQLQQINEGNKIAQEELELKNNMRQAVYVLIQLQNEVELLRAIVETANQRSEISNQRYVLGDISITDLTIAQREKDKTRREYVTALRNYWVAYYQLRAITGYDISSKKHITYE